MTTIEIKDNGATAAINRLASTITNRKPLLMMVGETIMERTKQRFSTSTGPDGKRWAPNARSTIEAFLAKRGGFGKRGINKKGQGLATSKKPLIAHGDLSRYIRYQVLNDSEVEVGTNWMAGIIKGGAAIHQFGGDAGKGHKTKIPARPFLPVTAAGAMYPEEERTILDSINSYIQRNGL